MLDDPGYKYSCSGRLASGYTVRTAIDVAVGSNLSLPYLVVSSRSTATRTAYLTIYKLTAGGCTDHQNQLGSRPFFYLWSFIIVFDLQFRFFLKTLA